VHDEHGGSAGDWNLAASLIEASREAYAGLAAARLAGGARPPADGALVRRDLAARQRDLVVALRERRPEHFARQVTWSAVAFAARGVPGTLLVDGLEALRDVLADELPERARAPVARCLDEALQAIEAAAPDAPGPPGLEAEGDAARLAVEYLCALLQGERRRAAELLEGAVGSGRLTVEEALLDVLVPAQREIGRMWHVDEIGVAEEHFATATTRRAIDRLTALSTARAPNGRCVLAAGAPGDLHAIGLQIAASLFELDGWRVIELGPDVPADELVLAARHFKPDLVALSATLGWQRSALQQTIGALRTASRARVLVGGSAFAEDDALWRSVGADGRARDLREAIAAGRALVGLPPSAADGPA
jgi:methanogenic corrinoid protein MtbC1